MNFCGIICEFNPFHNGHEYLIKNVKSKLNCDIVCIMSGDFVQRGQPAIECKYERAQKAVLAGADMVVEFPCIYACSNAENFAFGAIKTLAALGITHLAFGVENSTLETLDKIANLKLKNSLDFQNSFKNEIENGINFNTSLKRAIVKNFNNDENIKILLDKPNNILAIEYLCAIKKLNKKIIPIAIPRIDNGFYSKENSGKYLCASAIREKLSNGDSISDFIPKYATIKKAISNAEYQIFEKLALFNLRNSTPHQLETFYDYSEGIEYRIKEMSDKYSSLNEIIENVATPRYRKQRVSKLLIYPLIGITKSIVLKSKKTKPFSKLLCLNKNKKYLLATINKSKINLIVTNKDYKLLNKNQKDAINIDLTASNIYGISTNKINNIDKKIGVIFK